MAIASTIDRRQFLARSGVALSTATLGGLAVAQSLPACRAIHARLAEELGTAASRARLAANNVYSLAWEIACPCCGEPLLGERSEAPRF